MNVLLIDPVGDLREVERSLRAEADDVTVETVSDPAGAADADIEPDCAVVIDHDEAGVDGLEQLEAARIYLPDVPFVLVVRDPDDGDIRAGLDAGAADVITAGPEVQIDEEFPIAVVRRLRDVAGDGTSFQTEGEQLNSLMEYLPHQVFIKDDTGRIADASAAAAEEYGFSREQMIGLTDYELFPPSHADSLWEEEKAIMESEEPVINKTEHFVDEGGRDRWMSTTKAPRYDSDGDVVGIIGTTREVTEQHRQEEMMNALHAASRELVATETAREIAEIAVDIAEEIPDLPVVEVALTDDAGLAPVASGRGADDEGTPGESKEADFPVEPIETDSPIELTEDLPDAETTAADASEAADATDAVADATDADDAAGSTDAADVALVDRYDEWFRRAYETGRAQFIENRPDETGEVSVVEAAGDAGGDVDADPVAVTLPLGEHGVLGFASTSGTFSEFGVELAAVLAANMEAALDRAAREEALREREQDLADQNERLEEFASIVSHDLRNPLSVARGYLGQVDADEEIVAEIEWALDRMDRLTDELLTLARQGQIVGDTERISLSRVAYDAWQAIDGGAATLTVEDDVGSIEADPERLVELLENLFRNAVEHGSTSPDSQARQDAIEHAHGPDDPVTVRVGRTESGFFVEDDGPGIPDAEKGDVFEQGYTNADDGTGFGLYIVRTLADAHGWTVGVTDAKSGGARFEFAIESST